jgi:hypothetical protein
LLVGRRVGENELVPLPRPSPAVLETGRGGAAFPEGGNAVKHQQGHALPKKYVIRNAAEATYYCHGPIAPVFDADSRKARTFATAEAACAIMCHFQPRLDSCAVCELTEDGREIPV